MWKNRYNFILFLFFFYSYGQDPLWLVSNTLQLNIQSEDDVGETVILADSEVVSEGGMLESDALLLLNDSVNFLPISEGLPSSDKLLVCVARFIVLLKILLMIIKE